jgi:tRNA threonylcarbamoyladenosine biosynthesis protein TsaB
VGHSADSGLVLGIDTCGPIGSVALGRLAGTAVEILGQTELEGRSYSEMLVTTVSELLSGASVKKPDGIVAVYGPGSFTGVRLGMSAVKGLAEAWQIPVVVVSRLEVLARIAEVSDAALDAHRHEVYLRVCASDGSANERLAGAAELTEAPPARIAVCDESAAALLAEVLPSTEQVRTLAPTAADALRLCAERIAAGERVDLAMQDGHYLRRSDAEIFGEPTGARQP